MSIENVNYDIKIKKNDVFIKLCNYFNFVVFIYSNQLN